MAPLVSELIMPILARNLDLRNLHKILPNLLDFKNCDVENQYRKAASPVDVQLE